MKEFKSIYVYEVEVDSTYPAVHELFMHQTVFIRYVFGDGVPNKVRIQPDPMVKEDSKIIESQLKRIGARYKIAPRLNKA